MSERPRLRARAWQWLLGSLPVLCALVPGPAGAQVPVSLRITEPAGLQAGAVYTVDAGTPLRVSGVASEPSGVRRVLVSGAVARLLADPGVPGAVRFEASFVPARDARELTIVVEPNSGAAMTRSFALAVRAPVQTGQQAPTRVTSRPDSAVVPPGFATVPVIVVRPAPPSPWGHYALRGIGYGGVAGAGLFLASSRKAHTSEVCTGPAGQENCVDRTAVSRPNATLGLALVAGAAFMGVLDAVLTWRRAHALEPEPASAAAAPRMRFAPAIERTGGGARVRILRLRF